jgi:hypothetical protein
VSEFDVVGGIVVLVVVLGYAGVHTGALEGTLTLKVVPPWKRKGPAPKTTNPEPAAEDGVVAKLPDRAASG